MRVFIDTHLGVCRLDHRDPAKGEQVRQWLAEVAACHDVVIAASAPCN